MAEEDSRGDYQRSSLPDKVAIGGTLGLLAGLAAGYGFAGVVTAMAAGAALVSIYDEVMSRVA